MKPATLIFFLCFWSLSIFSQSPNAARAVKAAEQMAEKINLNDQQLQEVNKAYVHMYRQLDKLKGLPKDDELQDPALTKFQIHEDFNNTIANILNPKQLEEWNRFKSEKASRPKNYNGKPKPSLVEKINSAAQRKTERMTSQLKLSPEQQQQVFDAHVTHMTESTDLRYLSKENPKSVQDARKKIDESFNATIQQILNEEQQQRLATIKKQRNAQKEKIKKNQSASRTYTMSDKITQKAEKQTRLMTRRLHLNSEQKTAYRTACVEKYRALEQVKSSHGQKISPESTAAKKKIEEEFNEKLKKFLTAEQISSINSRN